MPSTSPGQEIQNELGTLLALSSGVAGLLVDSSSSRERRAGLVVCTGHGG